MNEQSPTWHEHDSNPRDGLEGIRYPEITVQLSGTDGNAFAILGKVRAALRRGGVTDEEIQTFAGEATSGNYDHLLATCMSWVDVT